MNTPSHLIFNLAILGRKESHKYQQAILLGVFLPDAPVILFYCYQKFIHPIPEQQIWTHHYYFEPWQNAFDGVNSLPFIAVAWSIAWKMHSRIGQLFFLSMLLHIFGVFPLHHNDGHRHFFPFSDWRFASPVSYWDPMHFGHIMSALEILAVFIAGSIIFRHSSLLTTKVVGFIGVAYAMYFFYAVWIWELYIMRMVFLLPSLLG